MSVLTSTWSLPVAVAAFGAGTAVIAVFGSRLARVVDVFADRTGLGEALSGAVLLGGATSLAGMTVSVLAAGAGNASLAISNSVGGIAAQTAFIVVADLVYRRANIEHAASSLQNLFNSLLLVVLLAIVIIGVATPPWTIAAVHPATPLLLFAYGYGLWLSRSVGEHPMWLPRRTPETRPDVPEPEAQRTNLIGLLVRFAGLAAMMLVAGYAVGRSGLSLVETTGLGGTLVGAFLTSVSTSLPELVTSVAAVRAGALTLAVGGIVGGNTFDVLFVAVADGVFREGSLYEAATEADVFVLGWTMVLVAIVAAGLVRREREGIGFEGVAVLVIYAAGVVTVSTMS